jgi:hypothetical protein
MNTLTTPKLSKTETLMKQIRKTPLFQQLIPMEAGIGWVMPLRREGKVYAIVPFFSFRSEQTTTLFPPFATLTVDWSTLVPVEYVDFRFRSPASSLAWNQAVGSFPHPAIAQLRQSEYLEKRQALLSHYDELFEHLSQGTPFSDRWITEFSTLLRLLMEPSLEPYYRAIAPKFCDRFLPSHSGEFR